MEEKDRPNLIFDAIEGKFKDPNMEENLKALFEFTDAPQDSDDEVEDTNHTDESSSCSVSSC